jgi:histone-lysine N-methyltransferase SETMAR
VAAQVAASWVSERVSVQTILKEDLNMRKLCAKIVPKVLTQEQKRRVACCQDWMENEEGSIFFQSVTGDESWIYEYDLETKRQSEEWKHGGSPHSKKARKNHSKIKIMLIVFLIFEEWSITNLFHRVKQLMLHFMWKFCLCECVRRVRPELWAEKNWILHHNNVPSHLVLIVREFFTKNDMITTDHPSYSPDLAPCNFFFCSLK